MPLTFEEARAQMEAEYKAARERYRLRVAEKKAKREARGKELAAQRKALADSGLTGTCQVCFRTYKATRGLLSLHGFRRPGDGYLHGECMGQKELPFEKSCEVTKKYLRMLESAKDRAEVAKARHEAGEIAEYTHSYEARTGSGFGREARTLKFVKLTRENTRPQYVQDAYYAGQDKIPTFEMKRQSVIRDLEGEIRQLSSDIRFYSEKVANWKPVG